MIKVEKMDYFVIWGLMKDSDNDIAIPDYVSNILNGILNTNLPKIFRWVAVYDLRSNDSTGKLIFHFPNFANRI